MCRVAVADYSGARLLLVSDVWHPKQFLSLNYHPSDAADAADALESKLYTVEDGRVSFDNRYNGSLR